jgi:hypothetical protein
MPPTYRREFYGMYVTVRDKDRFEISGKLIYWDDSAVILHSDGNGKIAIANKEIHSIRTKGGVAWLISSALSS